MSPMHRRYNKNVLKVFPYPITCTVLQFGVGSLLAITMWTLGLHPKPQISGQTVHGPFACLHIVYVPSFVDPPHSSLCGLSLLRHVPCLSRR